MEQKGNVTYPRPQMELVCVLDEAEQAGHLPETIVEEFTEHPFSMPALWACRDRFYRLDAAARRSHPALPSVFALLAAMEGDLDLAREYVSLLGTTPRHWRMQDLREKDYYRICTELVMPYISDGMFLRIVFFLVKTGMVPVRSLTLSACRPSIINGFRDFTRFGPYLERHKDAITQMIHQLYGSVGKNVYEIMLADEGACMVQMLFIYQRERGADDFTDRIMELAGGVSRYFPNYLKSPAEYYETLTETEKKVLRLMALGMSNDEIAERMGRKAGTVKFHSNSIFRKLRVSNRQQAVNRGRGIGLL